MRGLVICKFPLNFYKKQDVLIWRSTNTDEFFVCNAYHMEKERQDLLKGEGLKRLGCSGIWQLKIPNAAEMFIWRACNDLLPTKDNMLKKCIVNESPCPICGLHSEKYIMELSISNGCMCG
jgi:hypothetical protein